VNSKSINILDAILQGTTSRRALKELLIEMGELHRYHCLKDKLSERSAREKIRQELIRFMEATHYPRKGLKKLLDQVLSNVMCGYASQRRARMIADLMDAERDSKGPKSSWETLLAQNEAKRIKKALKEGRLGR